MHLVSHQSQQIVEPVVIVYGKNTKELTDTFHSTMIFT